MDKQTMKKIGKKALQVAPWVALGVGATIVVSKVWYHYNFDSAFKLTTENLKHLQTGPDAGLIMDSPIGKLVIFKEVYEVVK